MRVHQLPELSFVDLLVKWTGTMATAEDDDDAKYSTQY